MKPTTYNTRTIGARTTNGDVVRMTVPAEVCTEAQADVYRALWTEHVRHLGEWRGRVAAVVPAAVAPQVAQAMEFMGALVDVHQPCQSFEGEYPDFTLGAHVDTGEVVALPQAAGMVLIFSLGYWHHGF